MPAKILVTGGAGYLGSILVPELLGAGHQVTVIDNFRWRQNSLASCCSNPHFDVVRGDVRDEQVMKPLIVRHDLVVPLAALVGAPLCEQDKIGATTINRDAIQLIVNHLGKDQRMIIPVTNSGYGIGESGKFCTEETPLRPVSHYGVTKVEAEQIALSHPNAISLRLATVFGMSPRMRIDLLVNDFTYRALKDRVIVVFEGHFKRNYLHVRDVARAFIHAMDHFDAMKGQAYNVGMSDANLSKLELCAEIKKVIPALVYLESPIGEDPDKRDYLVSNEKIEQAGYRPIHSLHDGIREMVKGFNLINGSHYTNV